ncbi:transposase [Gelidibacter pelagius]|uniref:Transposase n=1 Tax=Gelidibacter pelagius TaxID=2819985 RepID=A0ABS3SNN0_9FLAO|nr:transposase [Gelidibacter pelagius]MBO3097319.1 transposase [Gelidibacter pelagius]
MKNRKRNRLKGYDYSRDNLYFVTICVQNMVCCLGRVVEGTGHDLSVRELSVGSENHDKLVSKESKKKMELNEYGLIVQNQINWLEAQYPYVLVHNYVIMPNHVHLIIEIDRLRIEHLSIKIKSLSSLIGAFKTTSSKMIHLAGFEDFAWKRSFHDHIIRQQKSYKNISNYIDANPEKWHQDGFFSNI